MRAARKKARERIREKKRKKGGARKRRGDPAGWHSRIDPKTKRKYYINDETKETSWKKPGDVEGAEKAPEDSKKDKEKKKEWHGWKKYKDPKTGRPYWHNKESGKTTWTDPKVEAQLKGQEARDKKKHLKAGKRKCKFPKVSTFKKI